MNPKYARTLSDFADQVGGQVAAAWSQWQDGTLDLDQFVAVVVAYLQAADDRATGLADTALAAFLTAYYRRPVPALGIVPPDVDHEPRVRELIDQDAPEEQWHSYGRGAALSRAQKAYGAAMTARPDITGWTRVLEAEACPVCTDLAGPTLPDTATMWHHPGCGCVQRPVVNQ